MPERSGTSPAPLANLRDLGGIEVAGGRIRPGLVLRADDVAITTPEQVTELVSQGLSTIIDLRSADEAARTGRGPAAQHPLQYLPLPLSEAMAVPASVQAGPEAAQADPTGISPELAARLLASIRSPEDVGRWYARVFMDRKQALVAGLQAVAEAPGTVLFHCAAGKDRTGVFAAALLTVLGAGPSAVAGDYARTQERLPAVYRRLGLQETLAAAEGISPDHPVLAAHPAAMDAMFAALDQAGGAAEVLRAGGLEPGLAQRLRQRLVQPVPARL